LQDATRTENTKKGHGWSMANDEFLKRKKNPAIWAAETPHMLE